MERPPYGCLVVLVTYGIAHPVRRTVVIHPSELPTNFYDLDDYQQPVVLESIVATRLDIPTWVISEIQNLVYADATGLLIRCGYTWQQMGLT